jgi:hypothetical protein
MRIVLRGRARLSAPLRRPRRRLRPKPKLSGTRACPWQRGRKLGDIVAQFARSLAADATVGDYAYPDVREHFA